MLAACVFVSTVMPVPMSASAVTWVCGDVNNDGSVSLSDVTSFNKYLNGMVDLVDYTKADTNADCVVDVVDRMILSNYITRVITSLPYTADGGGYASATTATTAVNSGMGYTIFDAATGAYASSYYLDANPIQDNSRAVIGEDNRESDDTLSGVVKLYTNAGGLGTGFVVDAHTIATAAHCVFNKSTGSFNTTNASLNRIEIYDENGNVEKTITNMYEVHIPNAYISDVTNRHLYDYALITVTDDLSAYADFNLGIATDGIIGSNAVVKVTGFPGDKNGKWTASGNIVTNSVFDYDRRLIYNADTKSGESGSPLYVRSEYGENGYNTVIGIHTSYIGFANCGVRMTTELLHFYKNNSNISWGDTDE